MASSSVWLKPLETPSAWAGLLGASADLRLAVELGHIGVWRYDVALKRLFGNEQAYRFLGLEPSAEGLTLDRVRAWVHPEDIAPVEAAIQLLQNNHEALDIQARLMRSDGSWAHVLTRRIIRRDESGRPTEWVGVAFDASTQVDQLRQASDRAQRLEVALSSAGVGIWSRDPKQERETWNEQMFKITGRQAALGGPTRDEWIYQIVHPSDRAAALEARAEISAEGLAVEHQYRIVRPDGEVRWLVNRARREERDGALTVFGITLDVTERVRAETALRSVSERVALAAHSVGIGTWEWDVSTGDALWDEAMFRLRGLEPQHYPLNVVQRMAMTHPEDQRTVSRALLEAASNTGTAAYEFRVVWPDGTIRWIASRSTPVPDAQGKPRRRIGVNWDITEAKQAEQSRREREVALRENQAKSEFLSRMSHELRTPLNAVLGFCQLLQLNAGNLHDPQRVQLAHIQSAGKHLLSLIEDVLDLSSLETDRLKLDIQSISLADVLAEALPLVDSMATEQGITLQTQPLRGNVMGDRTRLRQIMINLLSNAIKYNRPAGRVVITSVVHEDHHVTLHVQDTGRGMTEEQLAHLFEPFNRLGIEREGIAGTGIGLAVVKALLNRMQGQIDVASEPGQGSTFSVRLPQAPGSVLPLSPQRTHIHVPYSDSAQRQGQLLYIEDNEVNVLLLEELLRMRPGLKLVSAPNGQEGVIQALHLEPDLILVDIQLPDIDGFEVLRQLQQHPATSLIPCIALSANAMPEDIARAQAAGFADYWTKPIDFSNFLAALDQRFPVNH